ncbi:unnamed protein product, partial [marine sediment metagenome]
EEVRLAIKSLREKGIVRFGRYYDLYNSKSPIALKPRVHFNM